MKFHIYMKKKFLLAALLMSMSLAQPSYSMEEEDITFETSGTFRIGKGVTIKKGARVKIMPSKINY